MSMVKLDVMRLKAEILDVLKAGGQTMVTLEDACAELARRDEVHRAIAELVVQGQVKARPQPDDVRAPFVYSLTQAVRS